MSWTMIRLMLRLLTELVKAIGLEVAALGWDEDFLKAYQPSGPGCLVLDVRVPGMSGIELQKHLAAAGARCRSFSSRAMPT